MIEVISLVADEACARRRHGDQRQRALDIGDLVSFAPQLLLPTRCALPEIAFLKSRIAREIG
jgi:hypothetical protein